MLFFASRNERIFSSRRHPCFSRSGGLLIGGRSGALEEKGHFYLDERQHGNMALDLPNIGADMSSSIIQVG